MKKMIFAGFAALGILLAGCSKDDAPVIDKGGSDNGGSGKVTVTIKGETPTGRAIGSPTTDQEKTVKSFTVYVFNNSTGVLEKSQSFTSGLTGTIQNLSVASQKKVVVFVNQPEGYPAIGNYSDFTKVANMVALSTQVPGDFADTGLFMSGESNPVTLSTDNTVGVTVTVKRLTAKVRLGALTVTPDSGLSLGNFSLKGVSIQKARDHAAPMGRLLSSGFSYVGGVQAEGSGLPVVNFLNQVYNLPEGYSAGTKLSPEVYFYVFANDNTDNVATLMSIQGVYNGQPMYYSFHINDKIGSGNSTTDGEWIERNKIYTLNVTLKKIGTGGEDPNIPNEQVSMDVTVDVADWEAELIQEEEW